MCYTQIILVFYFTTKCIGLEDVHIKKLLSLSQYAGAEKITFRSPYKPNPFQLQILIFRLQLGSLGLKRLRCVASSITECMETDLIRINLVKYVKQILKLFCVNLFLKHL